MTEPVIHELGQRFRIITNVRRADVSRDAGWVVLELTGEEDELERGLAWLRERGVEIDPAGGDPVEG